MTQYRQMIINACRLAIQKVHRTCNLWIKRKNAKRNEESVTFSQRIRTRKCVNFVIKKSKYTNAFISCYFYELYDASHN